MSFTVIVPNRFPDIMGPLLESMVVHEPTLQLLVVANGPDAHLREYPGCKVILYGDQKFIFSKAINMALQATPGNIILLNDDCKLLRAGTLQQLDWIGQSRKEIGILSPLIMGCVCNPVQRWYEKESYWQSHNHMIYVHGADPVCFPCVWINRAAIDKIGLLAERFDKYGGEDNEYCNRMRANDFRVAVTNAVTVQHGDGGPELGPGRGKTWSLSFARLYPNGIK